MMQASNVKTSNIKVVDIFKTINLDLYLASFGIFYDLDVRPSELEILRCILQMLIWTKFHNPKINTCDNTKHYRSLWTKAIES